MSHARGTVYSKLFHLANCLCDKYDRLIGAVWRLYGGVACRPWFLFLIVVVWGHFIGNGQWCILCGNSRIVFESTSLVLFSVVWGHLFGTGGFGGRCNLEWNASQNRESSTVLAGVAPLTTERSMVVFGSIRIYSLFVLGSACRDASLFGWMVVNIVVVRFFFKFGSFGSAPPRPKKYVAIWRSALL